MKLERLHITAFVVLAAVVWLVVLRVRGTPVSPMHAEPFSIVVTVLVGAGVAFERVLWRLPWLHGWFVNRPDLRGTWRVEIRSSYVRPDTRDRGQVIVGYVGIKQTLSKLQLHLMTSESESWAVADHIRPSPRGHGFQVIVVYTNEPNVHLRDERVSEMHQGAMIIETHGPSLRPKSLTAKYWTDRKTTGTIEFTSRIDAVCSRFADAEHAVTADKNRSA